MTPLEQEQFWRNVEAKVSERQWQEVEKEKILGAIATCVLCPVSEKTEHIFDTHLRLVGSDRAAWHKP